MTEQVDRFIDALRATPLNSNRIYDLSDGAVINGYWTKEQIAAALCAALAKEQPR